MGLFKRQFGTVTALAYLSYSFPSHREPQVPTRARPCLSPFPPSSTLPVLSTPTTGSKVPVPSAWGAPAQTWVCQEAPMLCPDAMPHMSRLLSKEPTPSLAYSFLLPVSPLICSVFTHFYLCLSLLTGEGGIY